MRLRPGQQVAGMRLPQIAERADREFAETEEGSHHCRPFPVKIAELLSEGLKREDVLGDVYTGSPVHLLAEERYSEEYPRPPWWPPSPFGPPREPKGEWNHDPTQPIRTIAHVMPVHRDLLHPPDPPPRSAYPWRVRLRANVRARWDDARQSAALKIAPWLEPEEW